MMSRQSAGQEKFGTKERQSVEGRISFGKRTLMAVLAVILVTALIGSGLYFYKSSANKTEIDQATELAQVQQSFVTQNGTTAKILQSATQTKVYIVAWEDDKNQYISALLGGVWIKLYGQPLTAATSTPAPATTP